AAARSGSLITAHWAADQGRDVFALPGRVDQPMSRGTHKLIREGATLVEDPREVLAELYGAPSTKDRSEEAPAEDAQEEDIIMARLSTEDLTVDELVAATGMEVRALLNRLVEGELSGLIARAPGGLYRRVRRRR
ncbi:MAG: DNA-processing protein DprA, partial [Planctomycetota bacterium]|nr:DNA-processing protein DprA [Planctomycetota bacterium]